MKNIKEQLIEMWSKDPSLQVGVPYRRMAAEAANLILQSQEETDVNLSKGDRNEQDRITQAST